MWFTTAGKDGVKTLKAEDNRGVLVLSTGQQIRIVEAGGQLILTSNEKLSVIAHQDTSLLLSLGE